MENWQIIRNIAMPIFDILRKNQLSCEKLKLDSFSPWKIETDKYWASFKVKEECGQVYLEIILYNTPYGITRITYGSQNFFLCDPNVNEQAAEWIVEQIKKEELWKHN